MSGKSTNAAQPPAYSKAQILLALALYSYAPTVEDPTENSHSRAAFEALLALARTAGPVSASQADILHAQSKTNAPGPDMWSGVQNLCDSIADDDFYRALIDNDVEVAAPPPPLHPKFVEAGAKLSALVKRDGPAAGRRPEYAHLYRQMFDFGPEDFRREMETHAEHLGLIPKATHVDDQGRPVFSAEQLAATVGGTVEDVRRFVEESGMREGDLYSGPAHRIQ